MNERNLTDEITSVFNYIDTTLIGGNTSIKVNEYAYIWAVLNCKESLAFQCLSSIVMETTLSQMKEYFGIKTPNAIQDNNNIDGNPYSLFDDYMLKSENICDQIGAQSINSSILLLSIIKTHEEISKEMREFSVTSAQLFNAIKNQLSVYTTALVEIPKKHQKKKKNDVLEVSQPVKIINTSYQRNSEIDRCMTNLTEMASLGQIPHVINYDKYYTEIFTILLKKNCNNVAICGKSGVGKTATVKNIANIIAEKKCNANFHDKILVELDFSKFVVGTPFKGAFEQKFYSVLDEAKLSGNYIFFIDNLHYLINGTTKYAETDIETLLEVLFSEPSIQVICTITSKGFSRLQNKSPLGKYLQSITIEEPTIEESIQILDSTKSQYEIFHDVIYSEESIRSCIELCKKYIPNRALPDSAIDLMDLVGAKTSLVTEENSQLQELKQKLAEIIEEIEDIKSSSQNKEYEKIDELVKTQISIKSKISIIEKEAILSKEPSIITKNDVCSVLSRKIDIPLEDLTQSEKSRLKGLADKIKESVIGQDEAVEEVCKVVKRQRVGLGGNERPAVLMFLGSTGTGKTYLAKQLAKEVFGNEKYFVRLDMSEYSDKTSVSKISGSNPGYIGYDNETFLVKALKKHKRFILLLDEFEKSDEEVHNLFLQMFDEGRFTDNHGIEYSLKDVIIIMTSNVGVAESMNRGKVIGFANNDYDFSKSIIEKELKKKFKPEFINRIQKIIYFNTLKDDNIKNIIKLEINKLSKKIEDLGYHFSEEITNGKMVEDIYSEISSKKEYGARPIVNEVQRKIEDKIVDFIIDNDVNEGYTFTYEDISNLE